MPTKTSDGSRKEEPFFLGQNNGKRTKELFLLAKRTHSLVLDNAFLVKPKGGLPVGYQTNTLSLNSVFEGLEM